MLISEKKAQIKDLFLYPINSSRLSQHPFLVQKHWHEDFSLDQSRSEWRQDRWCNQHWVIDVRRQVWFLQPLAHWISSNSLFHPSCLSFPPVLVDCLAHLQKEVAEVSCLGIVSGKGWFQSGNLQWFVLRLWACTLTSALVSSRCQKQRQDDKEKPQEVPSHLSLRLILSTFAISSLGKTTTAATTIRSSIKMSFFPSCFPFLPQ